MRWVSFPLTHKKAAPEGAAKGELQPGRVPGFREHRGGPGCLAMLSGLVAGIAALAMLGEIEPVNLGLVVNAKAGD